MSSAVCDACQRMFSRSPGKRSPRSFTPPAIRNRHVHRADRFFFRAAAWPRDAGDSHADRAAHSPANSFRERDRNFRAHRAFCQNHLRRDVSPRRLQLIAVANHAAQKIRRAARDARQSLRQQSAGAAFRRGDRRVVQRQLVRHDFFERPAVLAVRCDRSARSRNLARFRRAFSSRAAASSVHRRR